MTTFQNLIEAFLSALDHLLPVSESFTRSLLEDALRWPAPSPALNLLVLLTASAVFMVHFRFDWLGLISAFLRSLAAPGSLSPARRTLDQHSLLFLLIVGTPFLLLRTAIGAAVEADEALRHPFLAGGLTLLLALVFHLSYRWNKRIHGLNHLRLAHGALLAALALFSLHPSLPLIGLLWIGFAFCNYHYESIFKYSMILLAVSIFCETGSLLRTTGIRDALDQIGHLNAVAVVVVAFTVFWIGLENLGKSLSEGTYRTFIWINGLIGIYLFASHFIPKG